MTGYSTGTATGTELSQDPQELQRRLAELKAGTAATLRTRLAHAHPYHITRIARGLFLVLTVGSVVLLLGSLVVPLLLPDVALLMREFESALPLPLPMLILFLALLMAVSWVTAGQAALAIARDCPLLPWEREELRKLENALGIMTHRAGGSGLVADTREGTPPPLQMPSSRLGGNQQQAFPSPVPTAGGTLRYQYNPPGGGGRGTPAPRGAAASRPFDRGTPAPPGGYGGPLVRAQTTDTEARRRATPSPTPAPASARRTPSPSLSYRGPNGAGRSTPGPASSRETPTSDVGIVQYERRPHDSYTIGPDTRSDFGGAASWKQPGFAQVDEPWLADALNKAQNLSQRYPVQAFLEYSVEPDLPFTLVLERATPAMAVRAMVDFVGFLASISTPRRARIELRSVVHLDRSFYRSVMSAMEPYFPDTVEIRQQGYRVEITFLDPDRNWARYPILPLEE